MSEPAARFIADTIRDESLARQFAELVKDRPFAEVVGEVVAFARARGYDLDREALVSVKARLDRERAGSAIPESGAAGEEPSDGDLSDDQLDPVSGGIFGWLQHQNRNATMGPTRDRDDKRTDPGNRAFWLGF